MDKKKILRAVNVCSIVFFVYYFVVWKFFRNHDDLLFSTFFLLFVSGLVGLTLTILWKQKLSSYYTIGFGFWTVWGGLQLLFHF